MKMIIILHVAITRPWEKHLLSIIFTVINEALQPESPSARSIQQKAIGPSCGEPCRTSCWVRQVDYRSWRWWRVWKRAVQRSQKTMRDWRLTSAMHPHLRRDTYPSPGRFRWWQSLINVMSMSALWDITLAAGCGPLLRVDDSLPGFTYIKGDPSLDTVQHSSSYLRASTGNHPAALDHTDKTWGLSWVPSIDPPPSQSYGQKINLIPWSIPRSTWLLSNW